MTHQPTSPRSVTGTRQLSLCFSATRRGARLARRFAVQQFTEWWDLPYDAEPARAVALVTAELSANAIGHGSLPGRDFRLTLLRLTEPAALRIEVTDTRPERRPREPVGEPAHLEATTGRGLLLVAAYADRWGCEVRDAHTKTVWVEVPVLP
ncbi:ATP-binding protein [Streptomyces sp. NRRL F-5126]|uniref:ATP-binding protein n=1 Tax=Streptomyces sp. NRRL F-5126 TaxID=1463857 RepID=UPI0004C687B1|nr:ATP-binding protein [Streptomyces sp. NRRL F-5126]